MINYSGISFCLLQRIFTPMSIKEKSNDFQRVNAWHSQSYLRFRFCAKDWKKWDWRDKLSEMNNLFSSIIHRDKWHSMMREDQWWWKIFLILFFSPCACFRFSWLIKDTPILSFSINSQTSDLYLSWKSRWVKSLKSKTMKWNFRKSRREFHGNIHVGFNQSVGCSLFVSIPLFAHECPSIVNAFLLFLLVLLFT